MVADTTADVTIPKESESGCNLIENNNMDLSHISFLKIISGR